MKRAAFFAALHTVAPGSTPEAAQAWIDFADNYIPTVFLPDKNKETRMEKLLDAIYADICVVRANYGVDAAKKIIDFSLYTCCVYPGEIRAAGKCLHNGGDPAVAYDGLALGDIKAEYPLFLMPLHPLTERDCGPEVAIVQEGVPSGWNQERIEPGYILRDGTVLLESERDDSGCYKGGAGMDGMYLRIPKLYRPVYTDDGRLWAFQQVRPAPENYLATVEMTAAGNCNQIDGIINNEAPSHPCGKLCGSIRRKSGNRIFTPPESRLNRNGDAHETDQY